MTPEQIAIVEATLEQARDDLELLAEDFYRRLFESEPRLRPLFTADPAEQRLRFGEQLDAIVHMIRDCEEFLSCAEDLGRRHGTYGVQPRHYALARPALMAALAAALGQRWTEDVEAAWLRAYDLVAEAMIAGAPDQRLPARDLDDRRHQPSNVSAIDGTSPPPN